MPSLTLFQFLVAVAVAVVIPGFGAYWQLRNKSDNNTTAIAELKNTVEANRVDINGGLQSLRKEVHEVEDRVTECEGTSRLVVQEVKHLTRAIESLTQTTARLSEQLVRMEEREQMRRLS